MQKLVFVFLLFAFVMVRGQDNWPPAYTITYDTALTQIPDNFWQMMEDSSGKWTIEEVQAASIARGFHNNNTKNKGLGFSGVRHYWQRLQLKNETGKELKLVFSNVPAVDRYDLYVVRAGGRTEHFVNGNDIPWSKRDGYKMYGSIPVSLAPGETAAIYKKLYIQASSRSEMVIGYTPLEKFLNTAHSDLEQWFRGDIRNGFIAGLLFFGFVFNIFFFWIVREKIYLYLALLLLLEGIWYATTGNTIFFRESPDSYKYFDLFITYSTFFFLVTQFVRHFLKTYRYYPRLDKLILTLMIATIVIAISRMFVLNAGYAAGTDISAFIQWMVFMLAMTSLFIAFLLPKKEKDRFTTLSLIAALPAIFVWSFIYGLGNITRFFSSAYGYVFPDSVKWLVRNTNIIEMFCVAWFAILFSWIMLQRYAILRKQLAVQALEREKERSEMMNRQKEELERQVQERTAELRQSIEDLKTTQKQLIQAEKMASLGELTAGIAHEIQNPLNFINNFSEISTELVDEMHVELKDGNKDEAMQLAANIRQNLEKVVFHGKRADSIVKGMLQHSRASSGQKQPTDINALADEYLRLSYHGLRARDKSFNAVLESHFDKNIGMVSVIAQDIGRVLLNIFNNAFYSIMQKKNLTSEGYQPMVSVRTLLCGNSIEIVIRDNGLGIPQKVMEKIYQPFFTTKPTGEGTGLGLSISYDIITKAHGGIMKVNTIEGEYAEFIIQLPYVQLPEPVTNMNSAPE